MKKVLSFVLVLIVVFSLGTNVIFADEYVENLVAMYENMGMTADALAAEFANYGIILDVNTMQITEASTGKVLSEEEFNTFMEAIIGDGSTAAAQTSPSGAALTEKDYDSEKVVYQIEKIGMKIKEGETEKKLHFKVTVYVMGTDAYLDYLLESAAMQQATYEESKFDKKRAIIVESFEASENELASNMSIGYILEEGFLTSKEQYVISMGDMSELLEQDQNVDGVPDYKKGDVYVTLAFKFGNDVETHEIVASGSNSKVVTHTNINWRNVLIIGLGVVVVALGVLIALLAIKGKKKVEKQNLLKDLNYVSEDKVFEALVEEAGVDAENEEIAEEIVEESEEIIEEVVEENNDTDEVEDSEEK